MQDMAANKDAGGNFESTRLNLPPALLAALREEAERRGVSLSELSRAILQEYFDGLPPDHPYRRRHPDPPPVE